MLDIARKTRSMAHFPYLSRRKAPKKRGAR